MQWLSRGWIEANPALVGVAIAVLVLVTIGYLARRR